MKNYLGETIHNQREVSGMTQDQFGAKYGVSGPAIFKFEKGYVKPSLELWLKMAREFDIQERKAVLIWVKSKLPEQFQEYIDLAAAAKPSGAGKRGKGSPARDYSKISNRAEMKEAAAKDALLPKALRELLNDEEIWSLFKPTGSEINLLRDTFGQMGKGSKASFREALRLIREFTGKE